MINSEMHARFRVVRDSADSIYKQHIADLHGPYEIIEPQLEYRNKQASYSNRVIAKCIACNTEWPCRTFTILEDWQQALITEKSSQRVDVYQTEDYTTISYEAIRYFNLFHTVNLSSKCHLAQHKQGNYCDIRSHYADTRKDNPS
jgi:hypothetical protein